MAGEPRLSRVAATETRLRRSFKAWSSRRQQSDRLDARVHPQLNEIREVDRDSGGLAAKRTILIDKMLPTLSRAAKALVVCFAFAGSQLGAQSPAFAGSRFDGQWNLVFATQRGDCDPSYNFTVDVVNGNIGHPNILTFRGHVASSGAVHASDRNTRPDRTRSPEGLAEASVAAARASRSVRERG
jgi:hypothetical protein